MSSCKMTYLLVDVFCSDDADLLGGGLDLVSSGGVVDELLLHCCVIL